MQFNILTLEKVQQDSEKLRSSITGVKIEGCDDSYVLQAGSPLMKGPSPS
jgi:hypothetical protein